MISYSVYCDYDFKGNICSNVGVYTSYVVAYNKLVTGLEEEYKGGIVLSNLLNEEWEIREVEII